MNALLPPWPEPARRLFTVGGEGAMRVVGGFVRNAVLGIPTGDIDFATTHTPDAMMALLEAHKIPVKPTGIDHGTITCFMDGSPYEITTLRRDVATDGRRAVVSFTTDWAEDAQRRDFTINALYADHTGQIFDETGQGWDDIKARRLRFIGDPATRIREDYLRILRLFRFMAVLPDFTADQEALAACAAHHDGLTSLSHERVTAEWRKILAAPMLVPALRAMEETGVAAFYGVTAKAIEAATRWTQLPVPRSEVVALYILFGANPPAFLILPKRTLRAWGGLANIMAGTMTWQESAYHHDLTMAHDVYVARTVCQNKDFSPDMWRDIAAYSVPTCPVTASDIQAREGLEGPDLGRRLKTLEQEWIEKTFQTQE